jgi:hypothetical protein
VCAWRVGGLRGCFGGVQACQAHWWGLVLPLGGPSEWPVGIWWLVSLGEPQPRRASVHEARKRRSRKRGSQGAMAGRGSLRGCCFFFLSFPPRFAARIFCVWIRPRGRERASEHTSAPLLGRLRKYYYCCSPPAHETAYGARGGHMRSPQGLMCGCCCCYGA